MGSVHHLSNALKSQGLRLGGDPPDNGDMEARLAKLEVSTDYIQRDVKELREDMRSMRSDIHSIRTTDFRLIFGVIISVALGLAWLMAKGFKWF